MRKRAQHARRIGGRRDRYENARAGAANARCGGGLDPGAIAARQRLRQAIRAIGATRRADRLGGDARHIGLQRFIVAQLAERLRKQVHRRRPTACHEQQVAGVIGRAADCSISIDRAASDTPSIAQPAGGAGDGHAGPHRQAGALWPPRTRGRSASAAYPRSSAIATPCLGQREGGAIAAVIGGGDHGAATRLDPIARDIGVSAASASMIPGRSFSGKVSGRSSAPAASTTSRALTCHSRSRGRSAAGAARWSVTRSTSPTWL